MVGFNSKLFGSQNVKNDQNGHSTLLGRFSQKCCSKRDKVLFGAFIKINEWAYVSFTDFLQKGKRGTQRVIF